MGNLHYLQSQQLYHRIFGIFVMSNLTELMQDAGELLIYLIALGPI